MNFQTWQRKLTLQSSVSDESTLQRFSKRRRLRKRHRLGLRAKFEILESRAMLAGDLIAISDEIHSSVGGNTELVAAQQQLVSDAARNDSFNFRASELALNTPNPIITEFVASNNNSLVDEDGNSSDWIEIFNAGNADLDLNGWYLTDDANNLTQWSFPEITLGVGEFLVVFASGNDRADADGTELHTNFRLGAGGEYLALIQSDGTTVASEFSPGFPPQSTDISYGITIEQSSQTLVNSSTPLLFTVPTNNDLGTSYTEVNFDTSSFTSSPNGAGFGYETNPNSGTSYLPLIELEAVIPDNTTSVFARYEFDLANPDEISQLLFRPTFDDGFIAYLNGVEVASFNAPNGTPSFNSFATNQRPDSEVLNEDSDTRVEFDLSEFIGQLNAGENVLAVHALNERGSSDFLFIPELVALNRVTVDTTDVGFFAMPTPGAVNGESFDGFVEEVQFSVERGFFDTAFDLVITPVTPDSITVVTTDGSVPTVDDDLNITNGELYTGPITIGETTNVRATGFRSGFGPSPVNTQTYLFLSDVAQQTASSQQRALSQGIASDAGGGVDFGLDPDILDSVTQQEFVDSLLSLPSISLTLDNDDFIGDGGLYTNPSQRGRASERPVSVELFNEDGSEEFQIDAGVRIQGAASRRLADKFSFRLSFRSVYGASELEYPLFGDGVDEFDTIVLRSVFNDGYGWTGSGREPLYVRDLWFRETQLALGQPAARGNWAHLYINGQYWGLYHPSERPDGDFAQETIGGNSDDYDTINHGGTIDDASDNNPDDSRTARQIYNEALALANAVVSAPGADAQWAAYQRLQGNSPDGLNDPNQEDFLDVENYIDYIILNLWAGNDDWPVNNWFTNRLRGAESDGFRFYAWDSEISLGLSNRTNVNEDFTNVSTGAAEFYGILRNYEEFRVQFADRLQTHLFNDGALAGDNPANRFQELASVVRGGILGESARWGDQHFVNNPVTPQDYDRALDDILTQYFVARPAIVLAQFQNANLFPNVSAANFSQRGGQVDAGFDLNLTAAAGTIYFTTDGSDPRLVGGQINPTATAFTSSIDIAETTLVRTRVLSDGGVWSALDEALFVATEQASPRELRISEIHFNPADPPSTSSFDNDEFEFIELVNTSTTGSIDLSGIQLAEGISFTFGDGVVAPVLGPGERILVVENLTAFVERYGDGLPVAGEWSGGLSNSGEQIELLDSSGERLASINYDDGELFSVAADGAGASLVLIDEFNTPEIEQGKFYRYASSVEFGGTPGTAGIRPSGVLINEILAHTDLPQRDTIELTNPTDAAVDVSELFLSDDGNDLFKFQIPSNTIIQPGGFLIFDELDFNPNPENPSDNDFALSANGDEVFLTRRNGLGEPEFVDAVQFGATLNGDSLGRFSSGFGRLSRQVSPTFGLPNANSQRSQLIISEFSYHPADPTSAAIEIDSDFDDDNLEFVELLNLSNSPIDLAEYRLRGQVEADFQPGTILQPGQVVVVTSLDPADQQSQDLFRAEYGIDSSVELINGFTGSLSNSFGLISLQRTSEPDADDLSATNFVAVDEVIYDDLPRFENADGNGLSLNRISSVSFANDAASWLAQSPTPGDSEIAFASVIGRGVAYRGATATYGGDLVDPNRVALRQGATEVTASFANYSNYREGLNRVVVEIADVKNPSLSNADFTFRVGNTNDRSLWTTLTDSSEIPLPTITLAESEVEGVSRYFLDWPNRAISSAWLEVVVLANENTNLGANDVFYFGSQIGDVDGSVSTTGQVTVNSFDTLSVIANASPNSDSVGIENVHDIDRDGAVTAFDTLDVTFNQAASGGLTLITLEAATPAVSATTFESVISDNAERPESIRQNLVQPLDINDDGDLSTLDALLAVNYLRRSNAASTLGHDEASASAKHYYDVNGDGEVSPIDLLQVVNGLRKSSSVQEPVIGQTPIAPPSTALPIATLETDIGDSEFNPEVGRSGISVGFATQSPQPIDSSVSPSGTTTIIEDDTIIELEPTPGELVDSVLTLDFGNLFNDFLR